MEDEPCAFTTLHVTAAAGEVVLNGVLPAYRGKGVYREPAARNDRYLHRCGCTHDSDRDADRQSGGAEGLGYRGLLACPVRIHDPHQFRGLKQGAMSFVVGVYARSRDAPLQQPETAELRKALQIGPMESAGVAGTSRLQLAWLRLEGSVGEPARDEAGSLSLLRAACIATDRMMPRTARCCGKSQAKISRRSVPSVAISASHFTIR